VANLVHPRGWELQGRMRKQQQQCQRDQGLHVHWHCTVQEAAVPTQQQGTNPGLPAAV
jgi:hypothetical protein